MSNRNSKRPELAVGDIVRPTAGRGCGRAYVVIEKIDHEYVKISDGSHRKVKNPKLKKNLHLERIGRTDTEVFSDSEIRKILFDARNLSEDN